MTSNFKQKHLLGLGSTTTKILSNFSSNNTFSKTYFFAKVSFRKTYPRVHEDKVHLGEREDDLQNIGIKIHFLFNILFENKC